MVLRESTPSGRLPGPEHRCRAVDDTMGGVGQPRLRARRTLAPMTDIRFASAGATFCNGRQVAEVSEEAMPGVDRVTIYLVRHCQSTGQAPDAPLTDLGRQQARRLADALDELGIERIIS